MVVIESPKEVDMAAEGAEGVEVVRGVAEQMAPPSAQAAGAAPPAEGKKEKKKKDKDKDKGEEKDKEKGEGGGKEKKEKRKKERKESKAAADGAADSGAKGEAATAGGGGAATAAPAPGTATEGTAPDAVAEGKEAALAALAASSASASPSAGAATAAAPDASQPPAAGVGGAAGATGAKKKPPPARNGVPKPGPKITVDSGITMDMMRVALAAWDGKEQGPKDGGGDSPRGRRKGKGEGAEDEDGMDLEKGEGFSPSAASSAGALVDPQATRPILSARFNQAVALLNVGLGVVYLCWRVFRSMNPKHDWHLWAPVGTYFVDPDDPEKAWSVLEELRWNWFSWLLFVAEVFLMLTIWLGHASRCFPVKRTKCTMDDLVDADFELSKRTQVCIVLPTSGEPLNTLRECVLHTMSLNLWPGRLDVRKNARLVVVDDKRRAEVLLLLALCYRFAALFCNNRKVGGWVRACVRACVGCV
jgi:hypothetical protein